VKRLVRFAFVGSICTLLQVVLQYAFSYIMPAVVANTIAFILSAQLNFMLSYRVTWHDSERKPWRALCAPLLQYNSLVWIAAAINTGAFVLFRAMMLTPDVIAVLRANLVRPDAVAIACATTVSTACMFAANHLYIFRKGSNDGSATRDGNLHASSE
jgi:putative flippase GtrA